MSNTYEGWSNEETFMVASIIDNDQNFLKKIIREVTKILAEVSKQQTENAVDPANVVKEFLDCVMFSGFESKFKAQAKHNPERALMWAVAFESMNTLRNRVNFEELAEHYMVKTVEDLLEYTEIACGNASVLPENNYRIAELVDKYMKPKPKTEVTDPLLLEIIEDL